MRTLVVFTMIFSSCFAFASWSVFSIISPDNIQKHEISLVKVLDTKDAIKFCLTDDEVRPSDTIIFKSAWLFEIDSVASAGELNFEEHFNKTAQNSNIKWIKNITAFSEASNSCQMQFKVNRHNIDKLFIFVGYEFEVNDGGLRYTIPLEAFQ